MTDTTHDKPVETDQAAKRQIPAVGLFGRSGAKPISQPDRNRSETHAVEAA